MSTSTIRANASFAPFFEDESRYLIAYGGSGSGKSRAAAQKWVLRCYSEPGHTILYVRNVFKDIRDSMIRATKWACQDMGITSQVQFLTTPLEVRFSNGSQIICRGCDDVQKLLSIDSVTGIWIEEAIQLDYAQDFDDIDARLRGATPGYKQIVLTFNPKDEKSWIHDRFFAQSNPKARVLFSTYRDNEFIDDEYKEVLNQKARANPAWARVYVEGKWGKADIKRPWAFNFSRDTHIGEATYNPKIAAILSFDFNVDPFVCLIAQAWRDAGGHHIAVIDEIVLKNGSVPDMIDRIEQRFGLAELSRLEITGDASQRKRDLNRADNRSSYQVIFDRLKISRPRRRVPRSNMLVKDSRDLVNFALHRHPDITIDPRCTLLIDELTYTEADEAGGIPKKNRNKVEQRADALDCFRYLIGEVVPDFQTNWAHYNAAQALT